MQYKRNHIIGEQFTELEFRNGEENVFLPNHVASVIKEKLMPAMETLFDDIASNKTITIDTLEIDIGAIPGKRWEEHFVHETMRQLRQKLNEVVSFTSPGENYEVLYKKEQPEIQAVQGVAKNMDSLIQFLETGTLPWNSSTGIKQLAQQLIEELQPGEEKNKLLHQLAATITGSETSLKRFLLQLDENTVEVLLRLIAATENHEFFFHFTGRMLSSVMPSSLRKKMLHVLLLLQSFSFTEIKNKAVAMLRKISFTPAELSNIQNIIIEEENTGSRLSDAELAVIKNSLAALQTMVTENKNAHQNIETKKANEIKQLTKEGERFFIENAGIVILHPFLQSFFSAMQLTEKNEFITPAMQRRAVLLTQFLVTGETEMQEHDLLLNKIFCGYPLHETLQTNIALTEMEQQETNDLLQSVIRHWAALKSTTAAGLRQSFLQRSGKLTSMNDYWLLQVEQKSYDVLLQFLPWSISIIKLPWMKKRVMVEWNA